ncbi:ribonuclease H-like protein [Annulohypoxylon bovei var. microspora]|nr:ribonuclease H-like protein [Annulohypoxylon bovei var. microspora]
MAQSSGAQKWRCECASAFDAPQYLGEHVKKTGHMKARWCTLCCRQFVSKEALEQHKKSAAKHKKNPTVQPKTNGSDKKTQVQKPKAAPNKLAAAPKSATAPKPATVPKVSKIGSMKENKKVAKSPTKISSNGNQPKKAFETAASTSRVAASTKPLNTLSSNYPWASGQQGAGLTKAIATHCHNEDTLIDQGYYTGDPYNRGNHRFVVKTFLLTPPRVNGLTKRKAIAIDCEMIGIAGGKDELAHLCAVDLVTGEVLINTLVNPTQPVRDWRTKYSGVTPAKMTMAKASGKVLNGWPAARQKLFEFADAETTLVGHSLNNDLRVLHIAHKRVVDSSILVAEAVFGKGNRLLHRWGLKRASRELLGITIQASRGGHDCLEDTLASRELVLWCLNEPEKLAQWSKNALTKYEEEKRKIRERQQAEAKARREKEEREREKERLHDDDVDNDYDNYFDDDYDYYNPHSHPIGDFGGRFRDYSYNQFHDHDSFWLDEDY